MNILRVDQKNILGKEMKSNYPLGNVRKKSDKQISTVLLIYMNDMPDESKSDVSLFVDNITLMMRIKVDADKERLQTDLYKLQDRFDKWSLEFSSSKYTITKIGEVAGSHD